MIDRLPPNFRLRPAKLYELGDLQEVERQAAQRFENFPQLGLSEAVTDEKTLRQAQDRGDLWVVVAIAEQTVVGFALAHPLDGALHLAEMDVLPDCGGRGLGTALLRHVLDTARQRRIPRVTLTTFRDVPWNAPFYARHGFRPLPQDAWTPGLSVLVEQEDAAGLRRSLRTVMGCEVPLP